MGRSYVNEIQTPEYRRLYTFAFTRSPPSSEPSSFTVTVPSSFPGFLPSLHPQNAPYIIISGQADDDNPPWPYCARLCWLNEQGKLALESSIYHVTCPGIVGLASFHRSRPSREPKKQHFIFPGSPDEPTRACNLCRVKWH